MGPDTQESSSSDTEVVTGRGYPQPPYRPSAELLTGHSGRIYTLERRLWTTTHATYRFIDRQETAHEKLNERMHGSESLQRNLQSRMEERVNGARGQGPRTEEPTRADREAHAAD